MVEINHVIETAIEREIVARPAGRALALDRLIYVDTLTSPMTAMPPMPLIT
jgi:folate-dependent tRNA-U54 methylase TrmFO/GidA